MPSHHPCSPQSHTIRPALNTPSDSAPLGVGPAVRPGVPVGVRLEADTQPDPAPYPTAQASRPAGGYPTVATDPLPGVSRRGESAEGRCRCPSR